jgi:hypothetical protein
MQHEPLEGPPDGVPEAQTKGPNHPLSACRSAGKGPSICKADLSYHQNMYMCVRIIADSLVSCNCQGRVLQKKILPNTSRILVPSVCSAGVASRMGVRVDLI